MSKEIPKREDLPIERTWRLEDIFKIDEDWEITYNQLQSRIPEITKFQGKLSESADTLFELLKLKDNLLEQLGKLNTYSHMRYDQDTTNSFYQAMYAKVGSLATKVSSAMSFIVPEILAMDEEKLYSFFNEKEELKEYRKALDDITRRRPHVLSEKEETLLANAREPLSTGIQTFSLLNHADLTFPMIKDENGNDVQLTHGRYIRFMKSRDRLVRINAFKAMYDTYRQFKNTFASTLNGTVKKNNFNARVRHYESARQAALDQNHIPEVVYDHLVEAVNEKLSLLHRYMKLRKKVLDVQELHMYDVYTPLVKDIEMDFTFDEAKKHVLKGLTSLGEEYNQILQEAFNNRWIDVDENKGKRSGAYSSGAYGTNPYILLNWQNSINNMFTLAHELGHSLHSYYTRKNQPYSYGNYSIFVAEVASTCNEALLNDYFLKKLDNDKEKIYLLNHFLEGFRGTVFRQTMFAEFEHEIHVKEQQGEALTADNLTEIYYNLNQKYFGEDAVVDEAIGLEWAKIPHFYYNYYVYQYATGYSAATTLANQILTEGESAVKRYLEFLKAGSSDDPIEVLKKAGVDMLSKQPVIDALTVFEEKLSELENLLLKE